MSDGYQVDPEAMERITRGINQAMVERTTTRATARPTRTRWAPSPATSSPTTRNYA